MFSLIVPAHNEAATILPTLNSLINQEKSPPYEIIVACNGCTDDTAAQARALTPPPNVALKKISVIESKKSGMSFGKNFGAAAANEAILIFIDADTLLPKNALHVIAKLLRESGDVIGTMGGKPDRGGLVVKTCFLIANLFTRRKKVHAPGGVMIMQKTVWEKIGGFDEQLPQGTSSDLIMRARAAGAQYLYVGEVKATTSIRRFEKTGIIRQMLAWRQNHRDLQHGKRAVVGERKYEDIL